MDFLKNIQGIDILLQAALAFLLLIYLVFSFLVVKQTVMLNKGFETEAAVLLKFLAIAHFLGTLVLFIFTAITLFV